MAFSSLISDYLPALLILLLNLLPFLLLLHTTKQKQKHTRAAAAVRLPPSPPKLPIIGNLHQLGKLPHHSLWKLSEKFGPVMLLRLGSMPTAVISSADAAKEILRNHDLDFCSRPPSLGAKRLSYNYLDVAFAPYSNYWREIRKLFVFELLSTKRVHSFWCARKAEVDHLFDFLEAAAPCRQAVNLGEKIFILADRIVGTVALGKSYGGMQFKNQSFQEVLDKAMNMLGSFSAEDIFPSVGWVVDAVTGRRARLEKSFRNLDGYFQMVLDAYLDPNRPKLEHEDLVDALIGLSSDQSGSFRLTKEHIKAVLTDIFIAGIDTSILMVWAMAELMRNPKAKEKVQAEIRRTIGKKNRVEPDDVAKLSYFKNVVKETFRLHPPLPLLVPHEAIRDCHIGGVDGGYDILAQTRVLVNAYAIGRDPKIWKNPHEFYPERFENSEIDFKGKHMELIPFGAGRRICPGLATGTTTIEFTLANLLYAFDFELPEGMKPEAISMEEQGGFAIHKKTPLIVVPRKFEWAE